MTIARLIAVIWIALGLQMPSDLQFRVCLCEGLLRAGFSTSHECRPARISSCCAQKKAEPSDRARCEREQRCRCVLVQTPSRPDTIHFTPIAANVDRCELRCVAAQRVETPSRPTARSRAHDPPGTRSNVPLRI